MIQTKFVLGSKNPAKIKALSEVLRNYDNFKDSEIEGTEVQTGVPEQPLSLDDVVRGAKTRALNSYQNINCNYSIGLESGFMLISKEEQKYIEFCACAIYDGKEFHLGFSPGFECPKEIMKFILEEGKDLSQASKEAGYTTSLDIGKEEGIIGILTKGKKDRTEYTKDAIIMAMIHIDRYKK